MPRILLRSGKSPFTPVSAEASLARNKWGVFGANVGNLLYSSAVHRALSVPGTEVVSNSLLTELGGVDDAYVQRINDEFDAFAVPLANAFRPSFVKSMNRLAGVIEKLTIPVTVIGVGAQLGPSQAPDEVSDDISQAAKRFVSAVLDRSASIGVRGEVTRDYLLGLGFPDSSIDVIGCPSLFHNGGDLRVAKRAGSLTAESKVAMNVTPSVRDAAALIERSVGEFPELVYVPQEHNDLALMMWGEQHGAISDPRIPTYMAHPLYQQNRMRFFLDSSTWTDFMATRDFVFGTRIHGNIAGLMAGVPALVIAHDSRTLELAQYHEIPHVLVSELSPDEGIAELYERADYSAFNAAEPQRFETYRAFLDRNNLRHVFDPENRNDAYDTQLAAVTFPPPVETLACDSDTFRETVVSRMRWLRQGAGTDSTRKAGSYRPPFGYTVHATAQGSGVTTESASAPGPANAKTVAGAPHSQPDPAASETARIIRSLQVRLEKQEERIVELERVNRQITDAFPVRAARRLRRSLRPRG